MEYKNTIITPKTDFPMKAGLPAREPGMLARWQEQDLYNLLLEKNKVLLFQEKLTQEQLKQTEKL